MTSLKIKQPQREVTFRGHNATKRNRVLIAEVSKAEQKDIVEHCTKLRISVSQFLAELALKDAEQNKQSARITITYQLSGEKPITRTLDPEHTNRLLMLARIQNEPVHDIMHTLIIDNLPGKAALDVPFYDLRVYLSDTEHETVMGHIAKTGISGRKYLAMLAMNHIKNRK
ncbi:MAG TPA: hypothetical protein VFK06_24570 [Candidatus Angelobacter sp.]|nr:hypothetical protein [Candidatus Angelobacter sp.]